MQIIAIAYLLYSVKDIYYTILDLWHGRKTVEQLAECSKCFSFWLVLIFTQNLEVALIVSLCVLIMDNYLSPRL